MSHRADMLTSEPAQIVSVIPDPAPYGIYRQQTNTEHYGASCAVCGWSIRREQRA